MFHPGLVQVRDTPASLQALLGYDFLGGVILCIHMYLISLQ